MHKLILANARFLMGKHKEAFDTYMDIVKDQPLAAAYCNIGYMYHRGIAVVRDYKKAISFYSAASFDDGGVSYFNMALMYLRAQGVETDFKKAIALMERSAEAGCVDAKLYLALAYIMGCAYDPIEIECLSLIPFYRVIYRNPCSFMLEGEGDDPSLEDKRYEAVEADADAAVRMYQSVISESSYDPYAETQCAAAEFMIGKAYIDGLGDLYNPELGYKKIYRTAINYGSTEAAQFLLANKETAKSYSVNIDKVENLALTRYFRPTMGNLGMPKTHNVPLLMPK